MVPENRKRAVVNHSDWERTLLRVVITAYNQGINLCGFDLFLPTLTETVNEWKVLEALLKKIPDKTLQIM